MTMPEIFPDDDFTLFQTSGSTGSIYPHVVHRGFSAVETPLEAEWTKFISMTGSCCFIRFPPKICLRSILTFDGRILTLCI